MKKFIIAMVALMGTMFTNANAMSYEQAREQALFLTDKMAYELNLTDAQYEAAYEINLDYLMSVNTYDDVYADYWVRRNADLRYVLLDWQYSAFCAATYFYRPIWWEGGYWHFGIYARYPHRDYFYFGRPHFYHTYVGGHAWHHNGGRSWYNGRTFVTRNHGNFSGMRDGWNRGDYRGGRHDVGGSRGNAGSRREVNGTRGNGSQQRNGFSGSRRSDNYGSGSRGSSTTRSGESVQPSRGSSSASGNFGGRRVGESRSSSVEGRSGVTRQSSTRSTVERSSSSSSNVSSSSARPSTSARPSSSSSYGSSSSSRTSSTAGHSGGFTSHSSSVTRGGSSSYGGGSHSGGSHGGGFSGRR